jgi:hypothetical protein
MKTVYRTEHGGVIGVIEEPATIDPERPLDEQLIVKIGVADDGTRLDVGDFESRARLVVLELRNYIEKDLGITRRTTKKN